MTTSVSVTMPVHNGAIFVSEAIDSVLGQTLRDLELIVVDDGSTDSTPEILARYAERDQRVVVRTQANRGYIAALNAASAIARGEFLARLDADDLAEPARLERQVAFFREHASIAVLGGSMLVVDATGRPFYLATYPLEPEDVLAALPQRTPLAHPTVMMRRSVFEASGGYRADFPHAEDYDLWVRIAQEHRLANLPDILGRYRVHGGNSSFQHLIEQAKSWTSARLAAGGTAKGDDQSEVAVATLDLALWWARLLTRAGGAYDRDARRAWRLARQAASATPVPAESRRQILQLRARLAVERGHAVRSRLYARRSSSQDPPGRKQPDVGTDVPGSPDVPQEPYAD